MSPERLWRPQPGPQFRFVACPVYEVFYGGARGGGKTDACLGDWLNHERLHGRAARGVFFRRRAKNLEDVIRRSAEVFPFLGSAWNGSSLTWTFPSGATLKFRHLWDAAAANDYQGHAYTRVYVEEATQWPDPGPIDLLRATLRSAEGAPVGLRLTGNPGGAGHNWVKARYITPAPLGYRILTDPATQETRVFIPARLEDNRLLLARDPAYERRLLASGSAALVKAWRWGEWDIVAGGFFDDLWRPDKHILPAFTPPAEWTFFRSFDWGSYAPASCGFWAYVTTTDPVPALGGRSFPRGSLIRLHEWYTSKTDEHGLVTPNQGQRLTNAELGAGIVKRSQGRRWAGCVADPSIWTEEGGASVYSQMRAGAQAAGGSLVFHKADNSRVAGWQKMREMLREAARDRPERPGLWVTAACVDWLRTIPVLQRDERRPDDVDTDGEDHLADETRYACMSRFAGAPTSVQVAHF